MKFWNNKTLINRRLPPQKYFTSIRFLQTNTKINIVFSTIDVENSKELEEYQFIENITLNKAKILRDELNLIINSIEKQKEQHRRGVFD